MFRHAFPGLPRRIRGSGARTLLGLQLRVCPQPNECASWTRHIIRISLIVFVMRSHQTHLGHNKWSLICCFRSQSEIVFENEREREREREYSGRIVIRCGFTPRVIATSPLRLPYARRPVLRASPQDFCMLVLQATLVWFSLDHRWNRNPRPQPHNL